MSDGPFDDLGDNLRTPASEITQDTDYQHTAPTVQKSFERVVEDLDARHSYGEHAAKEHAKEALEQLYSSEFPIGNPPDSFERYEAEMAVRHMRESIEGIFTPQPTKKKKEGSFEVDVSDDLVGEAKSRIDVMATYGNLAEPHISALTRVYHSEVREYATETLAGLREEQTETKSLTAAIREWWHAGE